MLKDEVVKAVRENHFNLYAVKTIEEGIELLTGLPAGQKDEFGQYPAESVFGRVTQKLQRYQVSLAVLEEYRRSRMQKREEAMTHLLERTGLAQRTVTRRMEEEPPRAAIRRACRELSPDLVALGTHGLTTLRHTLLGSTAARVLNESECDVLLVRPTGLHFELP